MGDYFMKEGVTELFYLCKLYNSPYTRKVFRNSSIGYLADFCRFCGKGEKSEFRVWLKGLDILKEEEDEEGKIKYFIVEAKLLKLIGDHPLALVYDKPFTARYEGLLRH